MYSIQNNHFTEPIFFFMQIIVTMLSLLFQITVFIGIIYGMHSAWIYVRDTHTPRKTKQLYDTHNNKYRNILEDLQQQMRLSEQNNQMNTDIDMYCATGDNYTQMNTMERELEEFMKREAFCA